VARGAVVGACGAAALAIAGCAGWGVQPTPNPSSAGNAFRAVSCPDVTDCLAVGSSDPNGTQSPLAERWNGRAWSVLPALSVPGAARGELSGVSCSSANACTAVGTYYTSAGVSTGFAARWNGSAWALQQIAAPQGSVGTSLQGVSCPTANRCVAVGVYYRPAGRYTVPLTLAEHWDGSNWTVKPTPSPSGDVFVRGVSCSSADACTAVGHLTNGGPEVPLAVRWNGSAWLLQSTPTAPGTVASRLEGVSCPTQLLCTAVGTTQTSTTSKALVERWSAGAWAVQPSPSPSSGPSQLLGVSCPTASLCTAVGLYSTSPIGNETTLAERWNGSKWMGEPMRTPAGGLGGRSWGVSCPTDTACTAVGWWAVQAGALRTLAQARFETPPQSR
jgi:hypothetical protein